MSKSSPAEIMPAKVPALTAVGCQYRLFPQFQKKSRSTFCDSPTWRIASSSDSVAMIWRCGAKSGRSFYAGGNALAKLNSTPSKPGFLATKRIAGNLINLNRPARLEARSFAAELRASRNW